MSKKIQWFTHVVINAPLKKVWEYSIDITKIPEFHPLVSKVDLISGKTKRETGVSYRCNITEGKQKGNCIEKVTEIINYEKFVTVIPEDSWGISNMFKNYTAETLFSEIDDKSTEISIIAYYNTAGIKAKFINFLAKRKMRQQAYDTLRGIKKKIEEYLK